MSELDIVERLRRRIPVFSRELIRGVGDDCAIIRPRGAAADQLVTSDMMLEGTHFRSGDPPEWVGRKALARAVSDIAAMGGEPRFCFLSIAAPSEQIVERVHEGLRSIASELEITIAGGDMARSEKLLIDVVVLGVVPRGQAIRRNRAEHRNIICVSGPLGRAASRSYRDMPEPRLRYGQNLRARATACIDISDGLAIDLYRLCLASNLQAHILGIPLFEGATVEHALYGGEDYELLFTLPRMPARRGLYFVGRMLEGEPGVWYEQKLLPISGYDHFHMGVD
jgi:thiamine-monophosphate kinase